MAAAIRRRGRTSNIKPIRRASGLDERLVIPNIDSGPALLLFDYSILFMLVFGGCCSNAWSLEALLKDNPQLGSALTFSQMVFIASQSSRPFIKFRDSSNNFTPLPRLKPPVVPLSRWLVQVVVLLGTSLLNNWAFTYRVPLSVQIVFRCAGLAVSMLFGYFFLKKRYTLQQIVSVVMVTAGVGLATYSRPASPASDLQDNPLLYFMGVGCLTLSLLLNGLLGILQERTYKEFGPHWQEGVFYTHFLALPMFWFMRGEITEGFRILSKPSHMIAGVIPSLYASMAVNVVSQLACVSGVNKLTSRVSSVSTNLVLTTRKALSLCISVWWFGNGWNTLLGVGAILVVIGTIMYAVAGEGSQAVPAKENGVHKRNTR